MDKVVHFEIPADDVKRAEEFYKDCFGWKINSVPEMKYTIVHTVEVDEKYMPKEVGAINGGMLKRTKPVDRVVITISVESIEKSFEKIKANGGKIVGEKRQVADMGYSAYFEDTEGNIIGIWETIKKQ